ncbi:olfactory receptor 6K3-like [Gastrophryne carolinensis]
MENGTTVNPSVMTLNFGPLTSERYLYATIVLSSYLLILSLSGVVISTSSLLYKNKNEPLYIFVCVLCFNGVYGSSAFYPSLFVNLLQKTQTISHIGCLVQAVFLHSYGGNEYTILTVMAYDRYLFICNPLRYHNIMTSSTVLQLISGAYIFSYVCNGTAILLTSRLPLCSSGILKIYCDNYSMVRLSCVATTVNDIFGVVTIIAMTVPTSLLVFYSYVLILKVCMKFSRDVRGKALQTCSPHLIVFTNFVIGTLFELLFYRFNTTKLPYELRVIMSLQFIVVSPILNPLIYGMKVKEIKVKIASCFLNIYGK